MDNSHRVRLGHRAGQITHNRGGLPGRKRCLVDFLLKAAAGHPLHDQVEQAFDLAPAVDLDHVGVCQPGQGLGFPFGPPLHGGQPQARREQQFHRHHAIQTGITRAINHPHATPIHLLEVRQAGDLGHVFRPVNACGPGMTRVASGPLRNLVYNGLDRLFMRRTGAAVRLPLQVLEWIQAPEPGFLLKGPRARFAPFEMFHQGGERQLAQGTIHGRAYGWLIGAAGRPCHGSNSSCSNRCKVCWTSR